MTAHAPKSGQINNDEGAENALPSRLGGSGENLAREGFTVDQHGAPEAL